MIDRDYFQRCVVISLNRTPQRLESFREELAKCNWPFREPELFSAIDGQIVPPAPWWVCGPGAWGAFRSHLSVIEDALNDSSIQRLLVTEDDATFCEDFAAKMMACVDALPSNWELFYAGGQTSHRNQRIDRTNSLVCQPESVNRLHAYALTRPGMEKVYRHLLRLDWQRGKQVTENGMTICKGASHVDHHIERLSRERQIATYAPATILDNPPTWLVDQSASYSEIMNRHMPERNFTEWSKERVPLVVIGPWRGGTSATAGAIHHLGISMGRQFFPANARAAPKGCFEAMILRKICNAAYPEPHFRESCSRDERVSLLKNWMDRRFKDQGYIIGAKNPLLCLMVPEVCEAWPECKFVVVHRPTDHVVDSLRKLGWFQPATNPEDIVTRLIETRDSDLAIVPNERQLHINFDDMLANKETTLKLIAAFAGVEPTPDHYAKAMQFLDPTLNHHGDNQKQCECGCNKGGACQCPRSSVAGSDNKLCDCNPAPTPAKKNRCERQTCGCR